MVRIELLVVTSTFLTCELLLQTWAQYSTAENRRRTSETLGVTLSIRQGKVELGGTPGAYY